MFDRLDEQHFSFSHYTSPMSLVRVRRYKMTHGMAFLIYYME